MTDTRTARLLAEIQARADTQAETVARQARTIASLTAKLSGARQRLLDQIAMLESALGMDFEGCPEWGLQAQEMRLLGLLLKRPILSNDQAMTALYAHVTDPPSQRMITVLVCNIRKKLGLTLRNVKGIGYALTQADRAKLVRQPLTNAQISRLELGRSPIENVA